MPLLLICVQVALMLQSVERLRSRQYKFFSAPPSPAARFVTKSQVRAYNRVVPLPLGLADIQVWSVAAI